MSKQVEVPEGAVEELARLIDPGRFEKSNGYGHQEFAEDDREARAAAREKAREALPSIYKHFEKRLLRNEVRLEAARALCPDEAHWEDFRERYEADASAALSAALQAASIPEEGGTQFQCAGPGCKRDYEVEGHATLPIDWGQRGAEIYCPDCSPGPEEGER